MKTTPFVFLSMALAAIPAMARQANPDLQPIGITHSLDHAFPESLARMHPNGGEARILVTIRADGELAEWLVTSYTASDFKTEAISALKEMKFSPARYKGDRITARSEITLSFETRGMLISTSTSMDSFEVATRSGPKFGAYQAVPVEKLDRLPKALRSVAPLYPQEVADRGFSGDVVVDFFIDESGEVKMPSVLGLDTSPLGEAAVRAVRQWRFETPMYQGKPALAHVQQVFKFAPTPRNGG
jgi:TonB family protein